MIDTFKELVANQYEAVLCMLQACIVKCPDDAWDSPVFRLRYCQVVFHTLFYTDLYLGESEEPFRRQPFHREHAAVFRDYEEAEDREPVLLYDKPWVSVYLEHCRKKAREVVLSETEESLSARAQFPRRSFSRAELHVVNIRHVQHHAAQLSLRLKIDSQQEVPWCGSGWQR